MVNIKKRYQIIKGYILIESIVAMGISALITTYFLDGLNQFIVSKQLLNNQVALLRTVQERKNQFAFAKNDFEFTRDNQLKVKVSADNWNKLRLLKIEGTETITFKILE